MSAATIGPWLAGALQFALVGGLILAVTLLIKRGYLTNPLRPRRRS